MRHQNGKKKAPEALLWSNNVFTQADLVSDPLFNQDPLEALDVVRYLQHLF